MHRAYKLHHAVGVVSLQRYTTGHIKKRIQLSTNLYNDALVVFLSFFFRLGVICGRKKGWKRTGKMWKKKKRVLSSCVFASKGIANDDRVVAARQSNFPSTTLTIMSVLKSPSRMQNTTDTDALLLHLNIIPIFCCCCCYCERINTTESVTVGAGTGYKALGRDYTQTIHDATIRPYSDTG